MKNPDKISVTIDPHILVPITENHGGYLAGECELCDKRGWLTDRLGNLSEDNLMSNQLIHEDDCPIAKFIRNKRNG